MARRLHIRSVIQLTWKLQLMIPYVTRAVTVTTFVQLPKLLMKGILFYMVYSLNIQLVQLQVERSLVKLLLFMMALSTLKVLTFWFVLGRVI